MVFPWRGEIPGSCPDAVRYHALFRDQRYVKDKTWLYNVLIILFQNQSLAESVSPMLIYQYFIVPVENSSVGLFGSTDPKRNFAEETVGAVADSVIQTANDARREPIASTPVNTNIPRETIAGYVGNIGKTDLNVPKVIAVVPAVGVEVS